MKIVQKLNAKKDMYNEKPVTIAFLGDSVTQGCFECITNRDGSVETLVDYKSAYSTRIRELLNVLYPDVQINIINSGISGDRTANALTRIERDILPYSPDLCVVSFGLNDSSAGLQNLNAYSESVYGIVDKLISRGIEVVFLTQNGMNACVSRHLKDEQLIEIAENKMAIQNDGILQQYMITGSASAKRAGAVICDLSSVWQKLYKAGVDTTELLANYINHPIREWHYYMAVKLIETFFEI